MSHHCITAAGPVLLPAQAFSAGYATMKPFPQEGDTPLSDRLKLLQPEGKHNSPTCNALPWAQHLLGYRP